MVHSKDCLDPVSDASDAPTAMRKPLSRLRVLMPSWARVVGPECAIAVAPRVLFDRAA